jgi:hypothetical protein
LITTLTDATRYGAAELADLYRQRWDVELFFRDIKTTMGMDVLRCRTPDLVKKEILMYFIAYNAIRRLIVGAANTVECAPRRISFKASIQALRQWEPQFHRRGCQRIERRAFARVSLRGHRRSSNHRSTRATRTSMFETTAQAFRPIDHLSPSNDRDSSSWPISCK